MLSVAAHHIRPGGASSTVRRSVGRRARRIGLWLFFVSIAVNAALGISAVLTPDFGETQGKILGTSLCVTGAVLLALACEPAWERRLLGPAPYAGASLGAAAFALVVGAIWAEPAEDAYGQITGSTFTIAIACVAASLLALARLAPRHQWVFVLTIGMLALAAAMVATVWWFEDEAPESYLRGMGVVLIVLAALAVSVPVLHWIDRGSLAAAEPEPGAVRFCPYCGKRLAGEIGVEPSCDRCGRGFRVTERSNVDLT